MHTFSEGESKLRAKRKGIFTRLLEALHRSRRRNAIQTLRRYRHLVAGKAQIRPASHMPQSRPTDKSSPNAHGNSALVHAIRQAREKARKQFA
jgi:hypothetical protein